MSARRSLIPMALMACGLLAACGDAGPTADELAAVEYAPDPAADPDVTWPVSTPERQGLDPDLVAEAYWNAERLESIYSLLVVKDGQLVAERYFHEGWENLQTNVQSVTKSYTSALVGIAIEEGCLAGLDEPMMTYFPELVDRVEDPRKEQITIRQLLQMRAGYPWLESTAEGKELLYSGFRPSNVVDVPLKRDPGSGWDYSNLSSHFLAIAVARGCEADLMDFAQEHLFGPLGVAPLDWTVDWEGYRLGYTELFASARELARFGQMYLDGGQWDGAQVVPSSWVEESWQPYTEDAWYYTVGANFGRTAYGYQWWIIDAGPHTYYLAWGHGGQQIAVL
ncbi:MAG: beta-lactamase family protein, partial [Actinomycetes bacterium]|nr:beta-lactamase family protein [Actinomycetes bacterium]MDX5380486.1 beta-lactamase family protein [Actinomycetes bacterium]MDX5399340.1 beta-lactamase family protein [Actinomycetes bacterium]MDX5450221.1 beta-lactamase family protein [Actinomycetes bacterium]